MYCSCNRHQDISSNVCMNGVTKGVIDTGVGARKMLKREDGVWVPPAVVLFADDAVVLGDVERRLQSGE